jgi:hypothetical protein
LTAYHAPAFQYVLFHDKTQNLYDFDPTNAQFRSDAVVYIQFLTAFRNKHLQKGFELNNNILILRNDKRDTIEISKQDGRIVYWNILLLMHDILDDGGYNLKGKEVGCKLLISGITL